MSTPISQSSHAPRCPNHPPMSATLRCDTCHVPLPFVREEGRLALLLCEVRVSAPRSRAGGTRRRPGTANSELPRAPASRHRGLAALSASRLPPLPRVERPAHICGKRVWRTGVVRPAAGDAAAWGGPAGSGGAAACGQGAQLKARGKSRLSHSASSSRPSTARTTPRPRPRAYATRARSSSAPAPDWSRTTPSARIAPRS